MQITFYDGAHFAKKTCANSDELATGAFQPKVELDLMFPTAGIFAVTSILNAEAAEFPPKESDTFDYEDEEADSDADFSAGGETQDDGTLGEPEGDGQPPGTEAETGPAGGQEELLGNQPDKSSAGQAPRAAGLAFPGDVQQSHLLGTQAAEDDDAEGVGKVTLGCGLFVEHQGQRSFGARSERRAVAAAEGQLHENPRSQRRGKKSGTFGNPGGDAQPPGTETELGPAYGQEERLGKQPDTSSAGHAPRAVGLAFPCAAQQLHAFETQAADEDAVCVGKVTLGSEQLFVEHQGQQQVSAADFGKSCDARWQCAREPQTGAPDCGWTSAAHQLAAPGKAQTSKKRGEKKQGSPAGPRQPSAAGPNRGKETLQIAGSRVGSAKAVQPCEEPQQFGSSAIESLALNVLAADHSFAGLSVAEVRSALGMSLADGVVRQALNRLVEHGQAFNTINDEKFAAI